MNRNKAISILTLVSLSLAVLFAVPTYAVVFAELDPAIGTVGTEVEMIGTINTEAGAYTIWFDVDNDGTAVGDTVVKTGNAPDESYAVNTKFLVPSCVGSDTGIAHKVTLEDDLSGDTYDVEFTLETSRTLTVPEYVQEGDPVVMNMSVTGGAANTVSNFTITVTDPATTASMNYNSSFTTDANGFGYNITNFPAEFSTGATSNFTGTYTIVADQTLPDAIANAATATFDVGLTNATVYERFETVNVKTSGWAPNQNITVTIKDPSMQNVSVWDPVNATDGTWTGDWTIPVDAPVGTYTVEVVNSTGDEKAVASIQTFTINSGALSVNFETDPATPLQRTETATAEFTIKYPDDSVYDNETSFDAIAVSVYYNTTLVDTISLSASDYTADDTWVVSWKIPRDAVLGIGYVFSLDVDSITDVEANMGPATAVVSESFTVQAATLNVEVTEQPEASYMRTEAVTTKIEITYPDDSFYTAADLGEIQVRVYQGVTNVANVTLEAQDFNSTTNEWTVSWTSPWDAILADDYRFTVKANEVVDVANPNSGPNADVSSDDFELIASTLIVESINTDKSSYMLDETVMVYFTAEYQNGSAVTTGTATITITMSNGTTTQLAATYVSAASRFEATYNLATEDPLGTWSALLDAQGLEDDENNMGPDESKAAVFTVTEVLQAEELTVNVKITPQSLNLKSNGKWVTVHIELSEGYSAEDIDVSSILLDGEVEPETSQVCDEGKLVVKFSRDAVQTHIKNTYAIEGSKFSKISLTITGEVAGTAFEDSDIIKVKN
ncbi:MAG: hypothetical protein NWF06_08900 [Candidatus Bathyarchaeota archaeon]|nr:hypothetical protein [Candidatus Bathyarchaeum sp.]